LRAAAFRNASCSPVSCIFSSKGEDHENSRHRPTTPAVASAGQHLRAAGQAESVMPKFEQAIPNILGKSLITVEADYAPGAESPSQGKDGFANRPAHRRSRRARLPQRRLSFWASRLQSATSLAIPPPFSRNVTMPVLGGGGRRRRRHRNIASLAFRPASVTARIETLEHLGDERSRSTIPASIRKIDASLLFAR
jgi:hypothetical protein